MLFMSRNRRHPLLSWFPITVMTVATFLVVLSMLAVQMKRGHDPLLGAQAPQSALVQGKSSNGTRVVTRGSGSKATTTVSTSSSSKHKASSTPAVSTRASGSRHGGEED